MIAVTKKQTASVHFCKLITVIVMKNLLLVTACIAAMLTIAGVQSCSSEYIEDVNKVCFENDVAPILVSNCTQSGCHNSIDLESGYDFATYDAVISTGTVSPGNYRSSELYKVLVTSGGDKAMPPDPFKQLSISQIETIALWIEQGAENLVCPPSDCNLNNTTFSGGVNPIIQTYCIGCHSGALPGGNINYSTYAGVKATVDNGKLLGSVKRDFGYLPMPQNGSKLSDCNIDIIQAWIDAGAPNN